MRLHRFIVDVHLQPSVTIADPALCHQLSRVFRMKKGDSIILCDGQGSEGTAVIEAIAKDHLTCSVSAITHVTAEPHRHVALYLAVLKRENFEWAVQKSVEAGISAIIPVISTRTVKTGLKLDRLRSIIKEAAEQSGRGVVPAVSEPVAFDAALQAVANPSTHVIFHCGEGAASAIGAVEGIWVGPEGGWTEEEVANAKARGIRVTSLGALTLRAETAAVIGSYLAVRG